MRLIDWLRAHAYTSAGWHPPARRMPLLQSLKQTEWNREFEHLMRNRLLMGAFRYNTISENRRRGIQYDRIASIQHRLDAYRQDRNLEHMVDVANLCMMEFAHAEGAHLTSVDDGHHAKKLP